MSQQLLTYLGVATTLGALQLPASSTTSTTGATDTTNNTDSTSTSITSSAASVEIAAICTVVRYNLQGVSVWTFDNVSLTNTGRVTLKTEFNSTQNQSYLSTTTITPTFSLIGSEGAVAVGDPVALTLTSGLTASGSGANASITSSSTDGALSTETGTSSSSSPSYNTTHHSSVSKTYSTGELAGAAVGCLIAGLLIASLLAFLCLRRRKQSRRPEYSSKREVFNSDGNEESMKLAGGPPANWQRHLPQPESDQTISRLANRTLDDIEMFVENFYDDRPTAQVGANLASDMSLFNSPYLGRPLVDIVYTSNVPTVLFKHCIAYCLLQKIDPTHNDSSGLLPREFVMPVKGDQKALSQLRVLMAHSQSNIDQDESYLVQRDRATQTIIQQIERAFQPWARGTPQDRAKNLRGVLVHLSELGNKLFSQPTTFEWRWGESRTPSQGRIVMLPGLDKTTDAQAVPLASPITLVEPRLNRFVQ